MKIAFIVCNEVFTPRVMELLSQNAIDYYTRWERVVGKGHGTEAHLGTRSFPSTNSMLMIAFRDENSLKVLIEEIQHTNDSIAKSDDRIRLFQLPLEKIL